MIENEVLPLGIDDNIARRMRAVIEDTAVPLPPSDRGNRENYNQWDTEETLEYGRWLCTLLELSPGETTGPAKVHIERASKLGIGPSASIINSLFENISGFQRSLGFENTRKMRFKDWSREAYVTAGRKLAAELGRRPSVSDIIDASKGQSAKFPSLHILYRRFGDLSVFHELIGYPNPTQWKVEDYVDWGVAFKIQNNGIRLTARRLGDLSRRGNGPSAPPVVARFGSTPEYDQVSEKAWLDREQAEKRRQEERLELLAQLAIYDPFLESIMESVPNDKILRVAGVYQLIRALAPRTSAIAARKVALTQLPATACRWIQQTNPHISMGRIETTAVMQNSFDDIWPSYRFQNVDLDVSSQIAA